MNAEEIEELKTEAKVQFTGEQLTQLVYRVVSLTRIMNVLDKRIGDLEANYSIGNKGRWFELRNELTYLHNELNEVKKLLGLMGYEPTIKPKNKYKSYEEG